MKFTAVVVSKLQKIIFILTPGHINSENGYDTFEDIVNYL